MPTAVATRVPNLNTARPGIRFAVILGHTVALGSLWLFGWIESLRPPVPPPLEVTLLAPAAVEKLENDIDRPFPVPPPAKPDDVAAPEPPPGDMAEPPPGDMAEPPVPPEDIPDINVDDLLPPPEPELPPEPQPEPPQPVPPEPVPPEPSPREPDITEVVQPPVPKPKPVEPKPEPKPVPPLPQPKPKPVPPKPVSPKPVSPQPKPKPVVVAPKPVSPKPPTDTVKQPTPAEVEADRMERIRKGLKTVEPKPTTPQIAALPPGGGKTLTAKDYEGRISAQIRNSVAPIIVSGKDEAASGEQTQDFYAALSKTLYQMWQQPSRLAVGDDRPTVRVSLTIRADGTVQGKHISGPSGVAAMDGSVEAVLRHLARVPAPSDYGNRNPSVTIDVAFELREDR